MPQLSSFHVQRSTALPLHARPKDITRGPYCLPNRRVQRPGLCWTLLHTLPCALVWGPCPGPLPAHTHSSLPAASASALSEHSNCSGDRSTSVLRYPLHKRWLPAPAVQSFGLRLWLRQDYSLPLQLFSVWIYVPLPPSMQKLPLFPASPLYFAFTSMKNSKVALKAHGFTACCIDRGRAPSMQLPEEGTPKVSCNRQPWCKNLFDWIRWNCPQHSLAPKLQPI